MSDPEKRYFEQEALARYPETSTLSSVGARREAFATGAQFGADTIRRQRAVSTEETRLRDEFAMCALSDYENVIETHEGRPEADKRMARHCYDIADAMMAERARRLADG